MLLPADLQTSLAMDLASHGCWHIARMPGQDELRARFPGECGDVLHIFNQAGGGCDFLHYHRRMMRHFRWLLQTPRPLFNLTPWSGPTLPAWVENAVKKEKPDFDLAATYKMIERLVKNGTVDELGMFIETASPRGNTPAPPGAGIHIRVHRAISIVETEMYSGDTTGDMKHLERAPLNVFFWTLHGWIDDFYAAWQRLHGEQPDQTPAKMEHINVTCVGVPKLPK